MSTTIGLVFDIAKSTMDGQKAAEPEEVAAEAQGATEPEEETVATQKTTDVEQTISETPTKRTRKSSK